MAKPDSEATGYAIEWKVEPSLWSEDEKETVELDRIAFTLYAKRIRGETTDVSLDKDQFWQQAEALVKRVVIPSCVLSFGQKFRLKEPEKWIRKDDNWQRYQELVCASLVSINYRSRLRSKDRDTEREARNCCVEIIKRSDDPTLQGVISYYYSAVMGVDQLTTAGNLYMAMEELWNNPEFGNLRGLARKLGLPHNKLKRVKQTANKGRHAFVARKRTGPLPPKQIRECREGVGELIRAYVEGLKKRS